MPVSEKLEVRVALDADLVLQARLLDLNLSQLLEASIRRALPTAGPTAGRTASDDTEAFDRYIEENGPFFRSSEVR